MPNWCSNSLHVTGSSYEIAKFREEVIGKRHGDKDEKENVLCFDKVVPTPKDLLTKEYGDGAYNWERDNWGCKWGAGDATLDYESDTELEYNFSTAWNPPIPFIKKAAEKYPELEFSLEYDEPGMCFRGEFSCVGNTILNDTSENYTPEVPATWGEEESEESITL